MVEGFLQAEVLEIVAERFDAEKRGELFVHPQYSVFGAGAEDVVSMVDLLQHGLELSTKLFVETEAEDVGDLGGGEPQQSHVAGAFEELMDGKVALEDEVAAVLDLLDRKQAVQVDRFTFFLGELGAQDKAPIVELFANDVGAQAVGSGLQGVGIGNRQEGVVVLAETHPLAQQFPFDEMMAVEPKRHREGQEGSNARGNWTCHLIPHTEVVMDLAAAL